MNPRPPLAATIRRLEQHADTLRAQFDLAADAMSRASIRSDQDAVSRALVGLKALDSGCTTTKLQPVRHQRTVRQIRVPVPVSTYTTKTLPPALPPQIGQQALSMPSTYRPVNDHDLEYETVWRPHRDAPSLIGNYDRRPRT